jgi:hypothetical protein
MKKLILIILLLFPTTALAVTFDIDTGGLGAYSSLNLFDTGEATDITSIGPYVINTRASGGAADATEVIFGTGWTTSEANDITVQQDSSQRHAGEFNASYYRLLGDAITGQDGMFVVNGADLDHMTLDGIQIRKINISDDDESGFRINGDGTYYVINSIFWCDPSSTGNYQDGIALWNASGVTLYAWNNLFYDCGGGAEAAGIASFGSGYTTYAYNNTFYGCENGINVDSGTVTAINNLVRDTPYPFYGTFTGASDYNSAPDATATDINSTQTSGSPWNSSGNNDSDFFLDSASDDFRPGESDLHVDEGYDLSGSFDYDAIATVRPQNSVFDLGWMELSAGPPPDFPTMMQGSGAFNWR